MRATNPCPGQCQPPLVPPFTEGDGFRRIRTPPALQQLLSDHIGAVVGSAAPEEEGLLTRLTRSLTGSSADAEVGSRLETLPLEKYSQILAVGDDGAPRSACLASIRALSRQV